MKRVDGQPSQPNQPNPPNQAGAGTGVGASQSPAIDSSASKMARWTCSVCSTVNHPWFDVCLRCGYDPQRKAAPQSITSSPQMPKPWVCNSCNRINSILEDKCRCGVPKDT